LYREYRDIYKGKLGLLVEERKVGGIGLGRGDREVGIIEGMGMEDRRLFR
jgi:hypothetical protein